MVVVVVMMMTLLLLLIIIMNNTNKESCMTIYIYIHRINIKRLCLKTFWYGEYLKAYEEKQRMYVRTAISYATINLLLQ